jgi:hypothetical protein
VVSARSACTAPPGLGQAILGHPLGLVQQAQRAAGVVVIGQHSAHGLELDSQRAEGVCEHVVDLAGDTRPLVQHRGPALLGAQLFHLRHQGGGLFRLAPVGGPVPAADEGHDEQ